MTLITVERDYRSGAWRCELLEWSWLRVFGSAIHCLKARAFTCKSAVFFALVCWLQLPASKNDLKRPVE